MIQANKYFKKMSSKNVVTTFKLNTNILFITMLFFSLINMLCFFGGMNWIVSSLNNPYVMFKGTQNNAPVCFAIKATRQVSKINIDRVKLDSISKINSTVKK
jgi:hypothetical protein